MRADLVYFYFYSGNYVPPSAELQPKTRPTDIKYLIGSYDYIVGTA